VNIFEWRSGMKVLTTIGLVLLMSRSGWAQTAAPVFRGIGNAVVDSAGDLVVFDSGESTTGVTVTGVRRSFFPPETRITIQPPGSGAPQTVTYNAGIQVLGTGTSAIYAIATAYNVSGNTVTTSRTLIAIKAGQALPAALSGFPSFALNSAVETRLGPSDYIALLSETAPTAGSTSTTFVRTAQVVHFNGSSFDVISTSTLP
jgi:hypothetical protein